MGTRIKSNLTGGGTIPINMYGVNLSASGSGKGLSTNILEQQVIGLFKQHFMERTISKQAELNLQIEANRRAKFLGKSPNEITQELNQEYVNMVLIALHFISATTPAIKQLRAKLLLAKIGASNIGIDEIGSNLESNTEVLNHIS